MYIVGMEYMRAGAIDALLLGGGSARLLHDAGRLGRVGS